MLQRVFSHLQRCLVFEWVPGLAGSVQSKVKLHVMSDQRQIYRLMLAVGRFYIYADTERVDAPLRSVQALTEQHFVRLSQSSILTPLQMFNV